MAYYYVALHNYNSSFCITPSAYQSLCFCLRRSQMWRYTLQMLNLKVTCNHVHYSQKETS